MVSGDEDDSSSVGRDDGVPPAAGVPRDGAGDGVHDDADDATGNNGDEVAGEEGRDDEETESEED